MGATTIPPTTFRPWLLCVLLALAPTTAAAQAGAGKPLAPPQLDIKAWRLDNGLQVLLLEQHRAPIATVQVFYHVGSKNERPGIRGIAHMFEHMMFKGTEHVPPEEHARLLKEVGGVSNAFTTEDLTAYHDTVPPSYVPFALQLEAERMRHLKLQPSTVDSERQVVMEEKRLRVDNEPIGRALEAFRNAAFTIHPYRWTAIGTMEDLQRITVADCQQFYDAWYQPNNATLVIVGDVHEAEVRAAVAVHFGAIPRGPEPPRPSITEPPQQQRRNEVLKLAVELPVVIGGYHIPAARGADLAALSVLSAILSGGDSSRLTRRLVRRDKLALGAGGVVQALEDPGLFVVYAAHLPDRDQARVRAALLDEIGRVRRDGVTAAELRKARNQVTAQDVYRLETVDGIATDIGQTQYLEGDWRRFLDQASRLMAVTAADVKRVAETYLRDENLTLVSLEPTGGVAGKP
jgi:zinc protease